MFFCFKFNYTMYIFEFSKKIINYIENMRCYIKKSSATRNIFIINPTGRFCIKNL